MRLRIEKAGSCFVLFSVSPLCWRIFRHCRFIITAATMFFFDTAEFSSEGEGGIGPRISLRASFTDLWAFEGSYEYTDC